MPFFFEKAYRRMGKHYFLLYLVFEFVSAIVVMPGDAWPVRAVHGPVRERVLADRAFARPVSWRSTAFMMWSGARRVRRSSDWLETAARDRARRVARRGGRAPRPTLRGRLAAVPARSACRSSIFATIVADLPAYSAVIIFAGAAVAVAYSAMLHFFSVRAVPAAGDRGHRRATCPRLHRARRWACRCAGSCSARCR